MCHIDDIEIANNFLKILAINCLIIFCISCNNNNNIDKKAVLNKVSGNTLYFTNNKKVKTNLYNIKYICALKTVKKSSYILLSGKTCDNCDENTAIYLLSPLDSIVSNDKLSKYSYPGKEYDYLTNDIIFESRMFYDTCDDSNKVRVIWFQKEYQNKKIVKNSIFIIEVSNDTIKESLFDGKAMSIDRMDSCYKELPGMNFSSEP